MSGWGLEMESGFVERVKMIPIKWLFLLFVKLATGVVVIVG